MTAERHLAIPILNEADSIGNTINVVERALEAGFIDSFVLLDGGSTDETLEIARARKVSVVDAAEIAPRGPVVGKGDSVSRYVNSLCDSTVVLGLVDADLGGLSPDHIRSLFEPFETVMSPVLVKADFERIDETNNPRLLRGGRITEFLVRPMLASLAPELAILGQPLSGQVAFRPVDCVGMRIHFGYGLEIGMLLQFHARYGSDSILQVSWGAIKNSEKSDLELLTVARDVAEAIASECLPPASLPARSRAVARPSQEL